ncbi:hypothetical protein LUCX_24 [Xanthomonas phage vB_XciM_LucasX]|nr:hypothetical protein LUCX_24 [Xanthomonas phage vB_XciM_LucasX]
MSAIAYDGVTLAGDRKSTKRNAEGVREVTSLEKEKIRIDFDRAVFAGHRIYAIGRAGRVPVSTFLLTLFDQNKDLAGQETWIEKQLRVKFSEPPASAALLIMTENAIHRLKVRKNYQVTVESYPRGKKLAIGSGRLLAEQAMEIFNLDAKAAVALQELHNDSCGGGVVYTSRKRIREGRPNRVESFTTPEDIKRYVLLRTVRSSAKVLSKLTTGETS